MHISVPAGILNDVILNVFYAYGNSGEVCSLAGILPVDITAFKGIVDKERVILQWKTSSEANTRLFEIEHSVTGTAFVKIGELPCENNLSGSKYEFATTLDGYFRLRIVDHDGSYKYSDIVKQQNPQRLKHGVYPNPVRGNHIKIVPQATKALGGSVLDAQGRLLKKFPIHSASYLLDITDIPAGLFFIRLHNGETFKIWKE